MKIKKKLKQIYQIYKKVGYHKKFLALFLLIVVTAVIEMLTIPNIIKNIVDIQIPQQNIKGLVCFTVIYVFLLMSQCYMVLKHCEMRSILSRQIGSDLREQIFEKLQYVKASFFDESSSGVILQYLQEDTQNAKKLFPIVITEMCVMGIVRFSIIAIFLMFVDIQITILILILYVIGFIITLLFNKKTIHHIRKIRKISTDIYSQVTEGVQSFFTIKNLGMMQNNVEDLEKSLSQYNKENYQLERIIATYESVFFLIISLSSIICIYFGVIKIWQGIMTYAQMMILIDYTNYLECEFNWVIKHLTDFKESLFANIKILQLLENQEVEDLDRGEELKEKITDIEFKNVSFSYQKVNKNIENFNLKIKENQKVALIGRTGSGKTTIVNLLERLYEPQKGEILINQENYLKYRISNIRNKIGYMLQEVQIVPNTIVDNIRYVNESITLEEIENIFKKLRFHDKIMTFPKGYKTDIYENPDLLSARRKTTD